MEQTCTNCRGTGLITQAPMMAGQPCPVCRPGLAAQPRILPPADDEIRTVPLLTTVAEGVLVKRPAGEALPAQVGPHGGISVGPAHLPGVGPVIHVAIHSGDGQTLICTMGAQAFAQLGALINDSARRIMAGEFNLSQTVN